MADDKPFDPEAFLRDRRARADKPFDPEEFLRKKREAAKADDTPLSNDPTYDMFVPVEAQRAQATPFSERAAHVGKYYGEGGLLAGDAATFGLANRGLAWGRAVLDPKPFDYSTKINEQNKYLQQLRDADPQRAIAAEIAGSVGSGAGLARAGITLAKPGAWWLERVARGIAEGAIQGGAQSGLQNYGSAADKVGSALQGAGLGGVLGGAVPAGTSAAGGVKSLFDMYRGNVPKYPPQLLRAIEADRIPSRALGGRVGVENLDTLGPDAMLVDAGPSLRRVAQGAITTPGPGASALEDALRIREAGTGQRMQQGTARAIGPDQVPSQVTRDIDADLAAMRPEWRAAFNNARAVDTRSIAGWLEREIQDKRGPAAAALQEVRDALNIRGMAGRQLDDFPGTLHSTREMIDGKLAARDIDPKVAFALRDARRQITEELHAKVPGMANLDARWAEIASRKGAFERGQELFETGRGSVVRPVEWEAEKAAMAAPKGGERATVSGPSAAPRYSERGTRAEVERVMQTETDDLRALENKFRSNWIVQKLTQQFGGNSVADLQHLIRTNRTFRENYNKIVHGSHTADKIEAAEDATRGYLNLQRFTPGGMVKFADDALAQAQAGYNASVRNRLAEILATRGPNLNDLRADLLREAERQSRNDIARSIVERGFRTGAVGTIPRITVTPRRD